MEHCDNKREDGSTTASVWQGVGTDPGDDAVRHQLFQLDLAA